MSTTIHADGRFVRVSNDGDDLSIAYEDSEFVISGDLSAFLDRMRDAVRLAEEPGEDDEPEQPCKECGEEAADDVGYTFTDGTVMCQSCTHNAYRSGWNGEGDDG